MKVPTIAVDNVCLAVLVVLMSGCTSLSGYQEQVLAKTWPLPEEDNSRTTASPPGLKESARALKEPTEVCYESSQTMSIRISNTAGTMERSVRDTGCIPVGADEAGNITLEQDPRSGVSKDYEILASKKGVATTQSILHSPGSPVLVVEDGGSKGIRVRIEFTPPRNPVPITQGAEQRRSFSMLNKEL